MQAIDLKLDQLVPSQTAVQKLRRAHFDKKAIEELAVSIKASGVMQPIVARRSQANGRADVFEIVAGERRWLGSKKAGVATIPVIVRDLGDDQVLEAQLTENLQRESMHPLEEAAGFDELMKQGKLTEAQVSDIVGRSAAYVAGRVKLLGLCPEAVKAFYDGTIDVSKALLLARILHKDMQRDALGEIETDAQGYAMPYREALELVRDRYMLRLKDAPFDVADEKLLPKAGPCTTCPKRTGNQKELFADMKDKDLCTDSKCFNEKRQAFYFIDVKALLDKGKKVLHGESAKKVFPYFQKSGSSSMSDAYKPMGEQVWTNDGARSPRDLLGPDYMLVQHPGTGKIIEVATSHAIAAALKDPKKKKAAAQRVKAKKNKGPDVDDVLRDRLQKLVLEKAPKAMGRSMLCGAMDAIVRQINLYDYEAGSISVSRGWPKSWRASYRSHLPKQAEKLDERGLTVLLWQIALGLTRWGEDRKRVLKTFGIDEAKVRELILEERKAARRAK